MDTSFSAEQNILRESISRYFTENFSLEKRRDIVKSNNGFDRSSWHEYSQMGWLSLLLAEDVGGFAGGDEEILILMEQVGRHLVMDPFVPTLVMFGRLIEKVGSLAQKTLYLQPLMNGELIGSVAYLEPGRRYDYLAPRTIAVPCAEGWLVTGKKSFVLNGGSADIVVVNATCENSGSGLFLVDTKSAGVTLRNHTSMDGHPLCDIELQGVMVSDASRLGDFGGSDELLEGVCLDACLALSAEALGLMDKVLSQSLAYSRTREQFGQAIGSFQAISHRLVDMYMHIEQVRSLLYKAVTEASGCQQARKKSIYGLKAFVCEASIKVGESAIQVHGGMGLTEELPTTHYFKRLAMISHLFGDENYHLHQYIGMEQRDG